MTTYPSNPNTQRIRWLDGLLLLLLLLQTACFGFQIPSVSRISHGESSGPATTIFSSRSSKDDSAPPLQDLRVHITGAGPSGLLLAHLLLKQGAKVALYESRPDPRSQSKALAGFAYALGLGIRGRTAIRAVDEELWQSVKQRGNECDRFRLHVGPFRFKLRDSQRKRQRQQRKNRNKTIDTDEALEPSLLLFQSDLCIALINELEQRYEGDDRFQLNFQSRVVECDLDRRRIRIDRNRNETLLGQYDLLVGCDGVNSIVRNAMKKLLPVLKLTNRPSQENSSGSSTAFMEPTVNGTCCILFAGRGGPDSSILGSISADSENKTATLAKTLLESFPLLQGVDFEDIADQLLSQKSGTASSVQCNVYHLGSSVAIAGDAAHATGGVSGQGVNSALLDAVALSDCIMTYYDRFSRQATLEKALLDYSKCQVPEGKALYDLSFGPKPTGVKKFIYLLKGIRDTVFQGRFGIGKPPLQTLLTTSVEPFSNIRRALDYYYNIPFPSQSSFNATVDATAASTT